MTETNTDAKEEFKKEVVLAKVSELIDEQDKPGDEKKAIKELFTYMTGLNLNKDQAVAIHKHPKYIQAAKDFAKDRSKSEIVINACNEILKELEESE